MIVPRIPAKVTILKRMPLAAVRVVVLFTLLCGMTTESRGQREGTAARSAKQDATRAIPFRELTRASQQKLGSIVERPSVYRRMPMESIQCDPDMFVFLVRHPEVIVNIWQLMGVTKVSTVRTGDFSLQATDGAGTTSNVELVYGTPDLHLYYAEGEYDGPMFPRKVRGRCVLLLRSFYEADASGKPFVRCSLDAFIKIDNLAADLVAKTFSNVIGKTADHNFVETTRFLSRLSDAAEKNAVGVQHMAARFSQVDSSITRKFAQIAAIVGQRADQRDASGGRTVQSSSHQSTPLQSSESRMAQPR